MARRGAIERAIIGGEQIFGEGQRGRIALHLRPEAAPHIGTLTLRAHDIPPGVGFDRHDASLPAAKWGAAGARARHRVLVAVLAGGPPVPYIGAGAIRAPAGAPRGGPRGGARGSP